MKLTNEVLQDSKEASFNDRYKDTHLRGHQFSNLGSDSRKTSRDKYGIIPSQVGEDLVKCNSQLRLIKERGIHGN